MTGAAVVEVHPDTYLDSVLLLSASRTLLDTPGVQWGAAFMGTPANLETLGAKGFSDGDLARVRANDLVLAVRADTEAAARAALVASHATLFSQRTPTGSADAATATRPRSLDEAVGQLSAANVAIVSVPGQFAALDAHKALSAGLHVLLFSDNVPVEEEVELKERARDLGLLLMGPGAGTAMLGGVGLGFANAVRAGSIGIVAAAGTGAQEVMSLVDRWGLGCSHVIGVGGRDLSAAVAGRMTRCALRALEDDPQTSVILLVSKPPAPEVASRVLGAPGSKPLVATLIGLTESVAAPERVHTTHTLEQGAATAVELAGGTRPAPGADLCGIAAAAIAGLAPRRTAVRGLFSGGTLCYEAMSLLAPRLGAIHSNTPLSPGWTLPHPVGAHAAIDHGEEEYTKGRPHPMIDPEARIEQIRREGADPTVAVILVDIVLGHGSHPDPGGALAPVLEEVAGASGPRVVAYVLGTDRDPQDAAGQRRRLLEAGCVVAPTGARAALLAAAVAERRPEIAEEQA